MVTLSPPEPPVLRQKKDFRSVAIYRAETKPISRSTGRSVVAAAAYRSGEDLTNEIDGREHKYSPRQSSVAHKAIFVPGGGPVDRSDLWNGAEDSEKRKDARTGREWVLALPHELTSEQRAELTDSFARELVERYGVAVDVAVHLPGDEGDDRNHHAHVMTTTRTIERGADGTLTFGDKSTIELSDKKRSSMGLGKAADEVKEVRQLWATLANVALERAGQEARIDHRTNEAQGLDRVPERHMGANVVALERKGHETPTGNHNRRIRAENAQRAEVIDFVRAKLEQAVKVMRDGFEKLAQAFDRLTPPVQQKAENAVNKWAAFAKGLKAGAAKNAEAERKRLAEERQRAEVAERERAEQKARDAKAYQETLQARAERRGRGR
ncbi:MobQ family relaxase [Acetobacter thailandicus]|uniref:MobQ family relaxase n=1 Tax=Acetobacter thailandicus TaxID=1502842 RepID=UPI0020114832|nr:MobQ family relaxase [Acetobacter thailandicus]